MRFKSLVMLGLLTLPLATAQAEDVKALLARADQAFAAADYQTALSLYQKLQPQVVDADQLSAMKERMRFATRQLAASVPNASPDPAAAGATSLAPATQPGMPDSNAATRQKHVRPADGQLLKITLHELGNFDYDENNDKSIPDDVRKLSGCKVSIPGVMLPLDQAGKVSRFMLVNDMMSCCYGTAPKLQHVIYVQLPKDKWIEATSERIQVEGTLQVKVRREDGYVLSIFEVEPTSVKLAAD
ncbi:MAG: DUF3299 domain-containing protein [Tepidisphaeraceae bacterium]